MMAAGGQRVASLPVSVDKMAMALPTCGSLPSAA